MKPVTEQEWRKRAIATHGKTYDYSKVVYVDHTTPVEIRCKVHGSFWQRPIYHTTSKCGCKECALRAPHYTTETWVAKANAVHKGKYDYSKVVFTHIHKHVTISCAIHGKFKQTAVNHINKHGCPRCKADKASLALVSGKQKFAKTKIVQVLGKNVLVSSNSEARVAKELLKLKLVVLDQRKTPVVEYVWKRRQHRYKPDFWIPSRNTLVEVKSLWTLGVLKGNPAKSLLSITKRKAEASRSLGYKHILVLVGRTTFCRLPEEWTSWSAYKIKTYYETQDHNRFD